MSYQAQTWVDQVGIDLCKNGGEAFVLVRVANHTGPDLRGCYASAGSIARLCKMGRSTVLKHMRELLARGVLLPGDAGLTEHLPADRRPPVYDLAAGHEPGCVGAHTIREDCRVGAGARSEHPGKRKRGAGGQNEHPSKKRRSAGVQSEHPDGRDGGAGVQNELWRVFKLSTNSCIELKLLSPCVVSGPSQPAATAEVEPVTAEREKRAGGDNTPTPPAAPAADTPPETATGDPYAANTAQAGTSPTADLGGRQNATHGRAQETARPSAGTAVADALAAQWRTAHATTPGRRQLAAVAADAADAIADGDNPDWLTDSVVPFMVRRRYLDLGRARTHRDCPRPRTASTGAATADGMCPDHPTYRAGSRCIPCVMA